MSDSSAAHPGPSPLRTERRRIPHLQRDADTGRKITILTAYDGAVAPILEAAGVDALLVGDSMGNVTLGYDTTLPVSLEDIERATAAVARSTSRPLIVADLPFGNFEESYAQAFASSARLLKAGAQSVKVEGGKVRAPLIESLVANGVPVMAHLGYTPQAEHVLGGPRLQGRGEAAAQLIADAHAVQEAGAWSVVLEMVPADVAAAITEQLTIPTIGIGAGPDCSGQVLVWTDMAGLTQWSPSFAKRFAELGESLRTAAADYVDQVQSGQFPSAQHHRNN